GTDQAKFQWQQVVLAIHPPPYFGIPWLGWYNRYKYLKQPANSDPSDDNTFSITGTNYCTSPSDNSGTPPPANTPVPVGRYFYVPESTLEQAYRYGWEYGVLAVPFKYQLSQGKDLQGQATLGGYL